MAAATLRQLFIKRGVGCYATPLAEGGRKTYVRRCGNNSSTPYGRGDSYDFLLLT